MGGLKATALPSAHVVEAAPSAFLRRTKNNGLLVIRWRDKYIDRFKSFGLTKNH